MDNKQYQRAVTPTIDGGASAAVRGKILTYSNNVATSTSSRTTMMGRPPTNTTTMNYRPSSTMSPRVTAQSSTVTDMSIQGRLAGNPISTSTSAKLSFGSSTQSNSVTDQLNSISVIPRYDLVPAYDDLPADGVVFARVRNQPDNMVVFRTPEERLRNPERLNLDRRQLEACPILEQEQRLRLLNYQNNMIKQISNLENLPNLIFLDLYNNQITSLEGPLSCVKGLRVLMAGKNKIQKICNLQTLKKLDVLDLHSNEIKLIEGLEGLGDLRVLNLAGNRISIVNSLSSLSSLTELNLRRNKIYSVQGLDKLPALQRVFLSHNAIQSLQDVSCIFAIQYLIELSLDGNPVADAEPTKYRQYIISTIPTLKHLDLKRINDEERTTSIEFPASMEILKIPAILNTNFASEMTSVEVSGVDEPESVKPDTLRIESLDPGLEKENMADKISGEQEQFFAGDDTETMEQSKLVNKEVIQHDSSETAQQIIQQPQLPSISNGPTTSIANVASPGEGIASLARNGRIPKIQSLFDIEVLGPDEKVMVIVGEVWEWNAPKRLLSAVTEACLLHIRRECLISKFNGTHVQSLSSLRSMRFLFNDFSSLKQVEFIPALYGASLQHLYILENPINQHAGHILRSYMIAMIPKLQTFNGIAVSPMERVAAEKAYQPFINMKSKSIKQFTAVSLKISKGTGAEQTNGEMSSPKSKKVNVSAQHHQHMQLYSDLQKHQSQCFSFDDYSQEFDHVLKDLISNVLVGLKPQNQLR